MLEILLYAGRAIMPLLLTMALGCWLRRSAHWSDDFYRQLNSFCFHVLLPVQLFLNVYAIEDLSVLNWRLLGFIVLCIVGAAGLGVAVAPLFARERAQRVVIAQATFRANQVIMGIPLASALGGQDALIFASLVTSVCVPVFNMLAVLMLTAYSTDGKSISWREEVRQIFRNPLILGALAGLVTVLVRQLLPQVDGQPVFSLRSGLPSIYKACSDLSKVASPLVLLILGAVAFVLLLFCNVPEEAAAPADAPAQKGGYDWRIIVPYVLVFGFYFIAEHGVMNWMVAYGVDGLGLPQASAAKYLSVFFGGMMIGRLCLSPLVDKLGALKSLAAFGGVSCVLYLIGSLGGAVTMPVWAISGLSFSILYPTLVMSIRLYFPAQQVSGAAGTILSIASLADILFNVGFGKLVDMTGYAVSIRVLPLSALAFFIVFILFTKFCKPTQKLK